MSNATFIGGSLNGEDMDVARLGRELRRPFYTDGLIKEEVYGRVPGSSFYVYLSTTEGFAADPREGLTEWLDANGID